MSSIVRVRLTGERDVLETLIGNLVAFGVPHDCFSRFYPNRGSTSVVRVYGDIVVDVSERKVGLSPALRGVESRK